jgi:hypothetical protein
MDQETKGLLEDIKRLENENNSLLLKLHNIQKWNLISRIVYWFILLGIAVGAFYFIKPFFGSIMGMYDFGGLNSISSPLDSLNSFNELFK